MRWPVLLVASLLVVPLAPSATADHVDEGEIRCDGGYCADGEHRELDCSQRQCEGESRAFPTIVAANYSDGTWLAPEDRVVTIEGEEEAYAYPVRILRFFETVHVEVDDRPLIVTYCPLCASTAVFDRRVDGTQLELLNSGEIWNNDLVMYDKTTGSRFSQILGEAITGPVHGTALDLVPSTTTTWSQFREHHQVPNVMRRPIGEDGAMLADYDSNPYRSYQHTRDTPQGRNAESDALLHPKDHVTGVKEQGEAIAFPHPVLEERRVVEATVGGLDVVAAWSGDTVVVYEQDDRQFEPGPSNETMVDQNGTRWTIATGRAGDERLERVATETTFWFAWLDFHPDTRLVNATEPTPANDTEVTQDVPARFAGLIGLAAAIAARARDGQL